MTTHPILGELASVESLGRAVAEEIAANAGCCIPRYLADINARALALPELSRGVALIAAERKRQVEAEGYTPEHDDEHVRGDLAVAAACYATQANQGLYESGEKARECMLRFWPWDAKWWKPTPGDRVRELVKAGALIVAEIERLQRAAGTATKERANGL